MSSTPRNQFPAREEDGAVNIHRIDSGRVMKHLQGAVWMLF